MDELDQEAEILKKLANRMNLRYIHYDRQDFVATVIDEKDQIRSWNPLRRNGDAFEVASYVLRCKTEVRDMPDPMAWARHSLIHFMLSTHDPESQEQ